MDPQFRADAAIVVLAVAPAPELLSVALPIDTPPAKKVTVPIGERSRLLSARRWP